jgi:hypothetical protein
MAFLTELKNILMFIQNHQKQPNSPNHLELKEKEWEVITSPGFKIYFKIVVITQHDIGI